MRYAVDHQWCSTSFCLLLLLLLLLLVLVSFLEEEEEDEEEEENLTSRSWGEGQPLSPKKDMTRTCSFCSRGIGHGMPALCIRRRLRASFSAQS